LAMAQRLASTLCPGTGKDIAFEGSLQLFAEKQFSDLPDEAKKIIVYPKVVKEVSPSEDCPTGTRGRAAVMEMFEMDKDIEQTILRNPTEFEISKVVRKKGMFTMKEDAMLKAFRGEIAFEEVNKL
jgi:type II secretory ATPase GspE/PulE/Tfp pilus assembly ATPase PilB-like protein